MYCNWTVCMSEVESLKDDQKAETNPIVEMMAAPVLRNNMSGK